ncbi:glycosyltransferase family 39 protein [Arsenicicoccus piscis]|uniref:ArnT family glycosyltransferase n=1 Tax=Arsenicicoccus piscis TaxID=673954 RepID=UPI001F4D2A3C|nr:glycosyltransferase family 39 protein [Arsenicicoccus piscis]MCH8626538.1 glycosyltransferase family 39 protein [Arsenicicoccus piscis]
MGTGGRRHAGTGELGGLVAVLAIAAVAYCWRLGEQGYANVYYAAAVQSAAHSWTSFFWGSVEWLNTQSMDKPPVFVWPMALSVRVFGMNPWAILLPQVLIMLAAILLLHRTVRRTHGGLAAVVAAAVMALTPIVLVMARFNDPDTALTLLAVGGAYATVRYVEAPRRRWLVLVGACVGLGFLCKWLAVFLPAVAFVAVLLADRALPLRARLRAVGVVGLSAAVFGLWWVVVYVLTPTGSRPNPDAASGGLADLLLGRNGLSRIVTHDPTTRNGMNGMPGFGRFVQWPMDGQIGWFLAPLVIALGLLAALPAARFIGPMAGRSLELRWIGKVLWVTWAVVCLGVLSFMAGSMHPYYVVIAVPAIAALIGIATDRVVAVARRDAEGARLAWILLGVVTVLTSTSGMVIMNAHADLPIGWLDVADVLVVVALAVVIGHRWWSRWPVARLLTPVGIALCALSMAWGPLAFDVVTVRHPVIGANPVAGPEAHVDTPVFDDAVVEFLRREYVGGGAAGAGGAGTGGGGASGGGAGGWAAAAPMASPAAQLQLQLDLPVLPLGGFTGRAFSPTLAEVQTWMRDGRLRYLVLTGPYRKAPDSSPPDFARRPVGDMVGWARTVGCRVTIPGSSVAVIDLTGRC